MSGPLYVDVEVDVVATGVETPEVDVTIPEPVAGVILVEGPAGAATSGADGYTPPFIFLYPRQQVDFGNGLDGRIPGANIADSGIAGCYMVGTNGPWASVDVYVAWMEGLASTAGDIVLTTYLGPVTEGVRPASVVVRNKQVISSAATSLCYHETLAASAVAVPPGGLLMGTVARYATDAADTYAAAAGVIGIVIRPH